MDRNEMVSRLEHVQAVLANDERDFLEEGKKTSALQAGHALEDVAAVIAALKEEGIPRPSGVRRP